MGGTESHMVGMMIDEKDNVRLLKYLKTGDYGPETKEKLINGVIECNRLNNAAKDKYGHGVSVKVIITNVADEHYLLRVKEKRQAGKDFGDEYTMMPGGEISPLYSDAIFHAKRDSCATGCSLGFVYKIKNVESRENIGYVTIAQYNSWTGGKGEKFSVSVCLSEEDNKLDKCLKWFDSNSSGEDVSTPLTYGQNEDFVTVYPYYESSTTAYLLVVLKVDDIPRFKKDLRR